MYLGSHSDVVHFDVDVPKYVPPMYATKCVRTKLLETVG